MTELMVLRLVRITECFANGLLKENDDAFDDHFVSELTDNLNNL